MQHEDLDISAVASSSQSHSLAKKLGIPLLEQGAFVSLDLTIDGADEVDLQLRMIKGGGGALFREKILLQSSLRSIILVDESKVVSTLGNFGVPVEISPFGCQATISRLKDLGYEGDWRRQYDNHYFVTDNGNYIYMVHSPNFYPNPEEDLAKMLQIRGVIDVGFVIANTEVWIGHADGSITEKKID
ncbi:ribose 5-phosphate isomerase A [Chlamydia ibidis 10-1398/6]|nr:ribose 5-phosphate isomerase A [Chlamydia ibidis 10-1398/6]